ncbi:MAG: MBL fold metallo-hydrolase [Clostridia bacterium]|nr:MBL fold metallo-hydrolase [Clostridia bacterium]
MACMIHPWEGYVKPFRIFGNLYFVGTSPASTHLIDTGDGLIVIDPGYPQSLYIVINNICELGFKIKDIKCIVITHGHYDHLGAARALKELTGAKTFIGKEDVTYANGTEDLTWAKELGTEYYEQFEPDVLISHGDVIELGNVKILCKDAPGHTPGTKAFFFDVTDGDKTLRAAMHGGVGMNSMKKQFLDKYGLSTEIREKFVPAIQSFIDEKVDILLGNHVGNNDTVGKSMKITDTFNPFIDDSAWKTFLLRCIDNYNELIKSETENRI